MDINAIIEAYKKHQITADEANKALADAGSNIRFNPDNAKGWTEEQMENGFLPGDPAVELPERPDMSRREELAGLPPVTQLTKHSAYDVYYDDLGYAVKAVKR